jgi:hypothetical protein
MTDLLDTAIAAHGGWARWQSINRLSARVTIGGAIWTFKGQGGALNDVVVDLDTHRQHVEQTPFGAPGQRSIFEPARTTIVSSDGVALSERDEPRAAFAGHARETAWDDHHLIYFRSYAMWTYLTTPFLFRMPGFRTEEIEPWEENGEAWRRLKVIFPASIHSHSAEQVFYFDAVGLLRRHDYSADVLGGTASANYASELQEFGGLVVPTKRRVYSRLPDNRPNIERLFVSIDVHDLEMS